MHLALKLTEHNKFAILLHHRVQEYITYLNKKYERLSVDNEELC
jgi:hypothetical protein